METTRLPIVKRRMILVVLSFIICHLSFCPARAQTFTERIQQKATDREGRLTISHSAAIDKLVNAGSKTIVATPPPMAKTSEKKDTTPTTAMMPLTTKGTSAKDTPTTPTTSPADKSPLRQEKDKNSASKGTATPPPTTDDNDDDSDGQTTVDTRKKVMRNSYRITGYRVQAYAGGNQRKDRQKAEQVGNDIKMNYPEEPIYVHFYSPRWICRVGNYRTYEEAHQMLVNIRKLGYTSATIVKGKISIQY